MPIFNLSQLLENLRQLIFGKPLSSKQVEQTLLSKFLALPVLCSDAISSVGYGTQQIVLALCLAGLWQPQFQHLYGEYTMTISAIIALLLIIVAASYWQTVFAYPGGGGSYIVSRANLGVSWGLLSAAALLIDYVLVVSVSVACGVQNLKDIPFLACLHIGDHMDVYCIGMIIFMTIANLRGLRDSGTLFAMPIYIFIGMSYLMLLIAFIGPLIGWQFHTEYVNQVVPPTLSTKAAGGFCLAVLLRAFATGCSALTGTEAVSNGVPIFREPKSKNAALTIVTMAFILGTIFMGVSWLAVKFHVVYWSDNGQMAPAVIDQISGTVFGKTGTSSFLYLIMQLSTAFTLIIAAQTGYADFPRLSSILARDRFMPRQLANLGDRLAFDNGIIVLGVLSSFLIWWKKGSVDLLIPFFTIGVFLAFTLSQAGMVHHWFSAKGPGWISKAMINGLGALTTFIVLLDIAVEKFVDGGWIVIVVIFCMIYMFHKIYKHYSDLNEQLDISNYSPPSKPVQNEVLVFIQGLHAGTMTALEYAKSISSDCKAIYVEIEPERTETLKKQWQEQKIDIPLIIIPSPYRSLTRPIMDYLDTVHAEHPEKRITVVVGEFVSDKWWHNLLHGNAGLLLKFALLGRKDVIVSNVRYWFPPKHNLAANK